GQHIPDPECRSHRNTADNVRRVCGSRRSPYKATLGVASAGLEVAYLAFVGFIRMNVSITVLSFIHFACIAGASSSADLLAILSLTDCGSSLPWFLLEEASL